MPSMSRDLKPTETYPAPMYDGGKVIALTALRGGTARTSICALLAHYLARQETHFSCCVISLSFSYGLQAYFPNNKHSAWHYNNYPQTKTRVKNWTRAQLSRLPNDSDSQNLSTLLEDLYKKRRMGTYLDESIHLKDYVLSVKGKSKVDVLFSDFEHAWLKDWSNLAYIIGKAKKQYDLIILDAPVGIVENWIDILCMVNFVIVPFKLTDWPIFLDDLRRIDNRIIQLKYDGYPIDISGIIPIDDNISQADNEELTNRGVQCLHKLFGEDRVFPLYRFSRKRNAVFQELKNTSGLSTYTDLFNKLISLRFKKQKKHSPDTIKKYQIIMNYVANNFDKTNQVHLSYESIAKQLGKEYRDKFKQPLTRVSVSKHLNEITIFRNKSQEECRADFRSVYEA